MDPNILWKAALASIKHTTLESLSEALQVPCNELEALVASNPALGNAIDAGRKYGTPTVLSLLSDEARALWNDLKNTDNIDKHQRALLLLADGGDTLRQRMLVFSLMETNFQTARCLRALKISKKQYDTWLANDPGFKELVEEIAFAKRNVAEEALFDLVVQRSEKAVMFANERLNRTDYGNKVEVNGQVEHTTGVLDLASLNLPFELERQLLEHMQNSGLVDTDGLLPS
jgi:hypothetical protein